MRKGLTNTLIIHILNNVMVHNYTSIYKTEKKKLKEFVKFSVYIIYQVLLDNSSLAFEDLGSNINVSNMLTNSAEYR